MWKIPSWEERKVSPAICEVYELFIQPLILLFYRVANLIIIFSSVQRRQCFLVFNSRTDFRLNDLAYIELLK